MISHLLVSKWVHVSDDLRGHLACVGGPVLERSLDDGHDQSQRRSVDEVHKLGVQQRLQAVMRLMRRVSQSVQQDGGDRCPIHNISSVSIYGSNLKRFPLCYPFHSNQTALAVKQ